MGQIGQQWKLMFDTYQMHRHKVVKTSIPGFKVYKGGHNVNDLG